MANNGYNMRYFDLILYEVCTQQHIFGFYETPNFNTCIMLFIFNTSGLLSRLYRMVALRYIFTIKHDFDT